MFSPCVALATMLIQLLSPLREALWTSRGLWLRPQV
jgi:hypothetical protein